jgi:hypothetical protein
LASRAAWLAVVVVVASCARTTIACGESRASRAMRASRLRVVCGPSARVRATPFERARTEKKTLRCTVRYFCVIPHHHQRVRSQTSRCAHDDPRTTTDILPTRNKKSTERADSRHATTPRRASISRHSSLIIHHSFITQFQTPLAMRRDVYARTRAYIVVHRRRHASSSSIVVVVVVVVVVQSQPICPTDHLGGPF